MNAEIYKIISETKDTMQVVILALVELQLPSGKKQIRKVSITRHLHKVVGKWSGLTSNLAVSRKEKVYVDYNDAVTKYRNRREQREQAA